MEKLNANKCSLCVGALSVILIIASIGLSLYAYNTSKNIEEQFDTFTRSLKGDLRNYEARLSDLEDLRSSSEDKTFLSFDTKKDVITDKGKNGASPSENDKLKKMNDFLAAMGLDLLLEEDDVDREAVKEIYNQHIKVQDIKYRLQESQEICAEQRQMDQEQYGDVMNDLYQRSLPPFAGNRATDEEIENALNELLYKYPDSYSAAMAAAFKSIESAIINDFESAEKYYDILLDMQVSKPGHVFLEGGLEAVPAAGHVLAWTYYRAGRTEEIEKIVELLDESYFDSIYRIREPGSNEMRYITGEEAISTLRRITGIER